MEKTLNELINELCPDGVEYKSLGDVCIIRSGKDHKTINSGNIPIYGSGGIMRYGDSPIYNKASVLIPRKGSISNLFFVDEPFWVVDTIFYTEIDEIVILPKFLYYTLSGKDLASLNKAGGVPSLTNSVLKRIPIPAPPLPVQEEIVRILDTMSTLTATLTAEKEARKKQYAYYREALLTFREDVKWIDLKTIAEIGTGKSDKKDASIDGEYPFYVRSATVARKNAYEYDDCSIIIPGEGGVGDIFHITNGKYALHQRAYRIHFKEDSGINTKFAYHYMRSAFKAFIQAKAVSATVASIRKPMIEKFSIPVPPLHVQEKIVSILDKLSDLAEGVDIGLPREIELAQKQYEYYLAKLLDFPEA